MRSAHANPNKNVTFQHVKRPTKTVARPECLFPHALYLLRWACLLFPLSAGSFRPFLHLAFPFLFLYLCFLLIETAEGLFPLFTSARRRRIPWIRLRYCQA